MGASRERAAAYTRTGILQRFLSVMDAACPDRIDGVWAEQKLGLKGGDVRAFLQSIRVLGIIDSFGRTTERARKIRALGQRSRILHESLEEAYPELVADWHRRGGMERRDVEDFFRVEYGLSASSSGPAAKLFCDLMRDVVPGTPLLREEPPIAATPPSPLPLLKEPPGAEPANEPRVTINIQVQIDSGWDDARLNSLLDRLERLAPVRGSKPGA